MPLLVLQSRMLTSRDRHRVRRGADRLWPRRAARPVPRARPARRVGSTSLVVDRSRSSPASRSASSAAARCSGCSCRSARSRPPAGSASPFVIAAALAARRAARPAQRWTSAWPARALRRRSAPALSRRSPRSRRRLLAYQLYDRQAAVPGHTPPQRARCSARRSSPRAAGRGRSAAIWRPEDDLRFIVRLARSSRSPTARSRGASSRRSRWRRCCAIADRRRRLARRAHARVGRRRVDRDRGVPAQGRLHDLGRLPGARGRGRRVARRRARAPRPRQTPDDGAGDAGRRAARRAVRRCSPSLDLGKDMQSFAEQLTSLLVGSDAVAVSRSTSRLLLLPTKAWMLVLGGIVGARLRARDDGVAARRRSAPRRARAAGSRRGGAAAALGAHRRCSPRSGRSAGSRSSRSTCRRRRCSRPTSELRKPGDELVIMGDLGHAPFAYAPDDAARDPVDERAIRSSRALARPNRVFAIAPQSELCALHREIGGKPYFVLDDRNTRNLLLSNRVDGTTDKNPLRDAIVHAEPKSIPTRPKGRSCSTASIELLGWDMPAERRRGDRFDGRRSTTRSCSRSAATWTSLMHFDGAAARPTAITSRSTAAARPRPGSPATTSSIASHGRRRRRRVTRPAATRSGSGSSPAAAPNWKNMTGQRGARRHARHRTIA